MGWTLDEVRALDVDEFDALIAWVHARGQKDDDAIDADALVDARRVKDEKDARGTG